MYSRVGTVRCVTDVRYHGRESCRSSIVMTVWIVVTVSNTLAVSYYCHKERQLRSEDYLALKRYLDCLLRFVRLAGVQSV